jgi:hypothetical protein
MRSRRVRRPSPALVVSVVALVVALGGTGYAAIVLPANSVGTKQLKRAAVTSTKIAANAVSSGKVKDRSLLAKDFAAGQLPAGPRGQTGPRGTTGGTGHAGRDGAAITARVRSTAAVDTSPDGGAVSIPLTGNTWTQAAGELDLGPFGAVTYTAPDASSCGGSGLADLTVRIDVDGTAFSFTSVATTRDGGTRKASFDASHYLFEPDHALPHVATVTVSSACESGPTPVSFHVSDLRLDLVRAT